MRSRLLKRLTPIMGVVLLALAASCSGGSTTIPDRIGEAFNLIIQASPDAGGSPLTVSFFAVPSGGEAPYDYAWDLNQDGVTDSNAPTTTFTYATLGLATAQVMVTDASGQTVTAQKTIIVNEQVKPTGDLLDVRFNVTPQFGPVPLNVEFTSFVSGGAPPYHFEWDFDGLNLGVQSLDPASIKNHPDWDPDSFLANPRFIYENIGTRVEDGLYLIYPVLVVTDGRGVMGSNIADADFDGEPDFKLPVNALPPMAGLEVAVAANPQSGQAPLFVELTASASGGSGDAEFKWDFGDGLETEYSNSSLASHTYLQSGVYQARCTSRDKKTNEMFTSSPVTISVSTEQTFTIEISADTATTVEDANGNEWEFVSGQVPFITNFQVFAVSGKEPIEYRWDVFDDDTAIPQGGNATTFTVQPTLQEPPGLNGAAVVTPDSTARKNPSTHFASAAYDNNGLEAYIVRCVATDAVGNTAISNLVRVRAEPRNSAQYYEAHRPEVAFRTGFPIWETGAPSASPILLPTGPSPWGARANPAVCSHPSGISYIIGGEILDENGRFDRLVPQNDSNYMYVPRTNAIAYSGGAAIGKFNVNTHGGSMIRLNGGAAPAFPLSQDRQDAVAAAFGPPVPTNRSTGFQVVGSAAAVFMHEVPETNKEGAYIDRRYDPNVQGPYPDCPDSNWGLDAPPFNTNGLGTPVIYVFGGRVGAMTPVDLVQKYYVYGFGSEDMRNGMSDDTAYGFPPDYEYQLTGNQTDLWSNYFLRPDTDQLPHQDADPQIDPRRSGGTGDTLDLPNLPTPLYGLMACKIETAVTGSAAIGVDSPSPSFPNGPFSNVFIFGGIDQNGAVHREMRYWNTGLTGEGDAIGIDDGLWSEVADMPIGRAYGKAILIPPINGQTRIALVGGVDDTGTPLKSIDIFTFNDNLNPNGGSWETFSGMLPEALEAGGAGYNSSHEPSQSWLAVMGGWNGEDYSPNMYTVRVNAGEAKGNIVSEPLPVVPRRNIGATQGGSWLLSAMLGGALTYNRYYLFAGTDENGTDSVVEVVSLP